MLPSRHWPQWTHTHTFELTNNPTHLFTCPTYSLLNTHTSIFDELFIFKSFVRSLIFRCGCSSCQYGNINYQTIDNANKNSLFILNYSCFLMVWKLFVLMEYVLKPSRSAGAVVKQLVCICVLCGCSVVSYRPKEPAHKSLSWNLNQCFVAHFIVCQAKKSYRLYQMHH